MNTLLRAVSVTFVIALSGCASMGTKIDRGTVQAIERGKTTRTQLETSVGVPLTTNIMPDGKRMAFYLYSESKMDPSIAIPFVGPFFSQTKTRQQNLQVIYTKDGVVDDYEFTDQTNLTQGTLGAARHTTNNTPTDVK